MIVIKEYTINDYSIGELVHTKKGNLYINEILYNENKVIVAQKKEYENFNKLKIKYKFKINKINKIAKPGDIIKIDNVLYIIVLTHGGGKNLVDLNLVDLIQGANQWGIKELSVDNLKQYISSELQKRTVPLSDVKVTSDVSAVNVEIKVSNKKANIVQFSNDI